MESTIKNLIKFYKPKTGLFRKYTPNPEKTRPVLYGIITGDIAGSLYEGEQLKQIEDIYKENLLGKRHHFTDDSVMSVAIYEATKICIADSLHGNTAIDIYATSMKKYVKMYPHAGYGRHFRQWASGENSEPYQSFGDGSAMRSGIIGAMFGDVEDVIEYAYYSAVPTHSHPDGIKGAVVTSVLVWMALHGFAKDKMLIYADKYYQPPKEQGRYFNTVYPALPHKYLRNDGKYQTLGIDCNTAVPLAFINFYASNDYEDCLRNCLFYDSDTDTVMAISGGIAAAYYDESTVQGRTTEEIVKEKIPQELLSI